MQQARRRAHTAALPTAACVIYLYHIIRTTGRVETRTTPPPFSLYEKIRHLQDVVRDSVEIFHTTTPAFSLWVLLTVPRR